MLAGALAMATFQYIIYQAIRFDGAGAVLFCCFLIALDTADTGAGDVDVVVCSISKASKRNLPTHEPHQVFSILGNKLSLFSNITNRL